MDEIDVMEYDKKDDNAQIDITINEHLLDYILIEYWENGAWR